MAKKKFYAVAQGFKTGIFASWDECSAQVKGFSGALYKGFATRMEAEAWLRSQMNEPDEISVTEYKEAAALQSSDSLKVSQLSEKEIKEAMLFKLKEKLEASRRRSSAVSSSVQDFCQRFGYAHLSCEQRQAVGQIDGRTLLFAVPGSGKTTVLLARTGYLLYGAHNKSILPQEIVNLTFTRAAAREMKARYRKKFPMGDMPEFRTIHSFCLNFILQKLKDAGWCLPKHFLGDNIKAPGSEKSGRQRRITVQSVFQESLACLEIKKRLDDDDCEQLRLYITWIKNRMLKPEDLAEKELALEGSKISVLDFYNAYEAVLRKYDCFDFDDMLHYAYEGLQKEPRILAALRQRFHYWSIDETQDNSRLQNCLIDLLTGDEGNLFVVGDDDQSIYYFRGAEPTLLLEYAVRPDVQVLEMNTNYRSCRWIVDMARAFIERNLVRAAKGMCACANASNGDIKFFTQLPSASAQYEHIVARAKEAAESGKSLAVIYRMNYSAFPIVFWLKKAGISYRNFKPFSELCNGKIFRQALLLLRFLANPDSFELFDKCRHWLGLHHLTQEMLDELKRLTKVQKHRPILELLSWINTNSMGQSALAEEYDKFREIMQGVQGLTTQEIICYLLKKDVLNVEDKRSERLKLCALLGAAEVYTELSEFVKIEEELFSQQESETEMFSVTLTTMHKAKGLEFDSVLLIDMLEQKNDSDIGSDCDNLLCIDDEEERRLFYVAVTRAISNLEFLTVQSYYGNIEQPSGFLSECAAFYEDLTEEILLERPMISPSAIHNAFSCPVASEKYYSVRKGRKPGVYTSWSECQEQVNGFSGAEYESFSNRQEAEAYCGIAPKVLLRHEFLNEFLLPVSVRSFNYSVDLPDAIQQGIMDWFHVSSLSELSFQRRRELQKQKFSWYSNQVIDYHDLAEGYLLVYFPVNFYKIWLPLSRCLEKNALPLQADVLELGPGPGTSALSLFEFYYRLAKENSDCSFALRYLAIERELSFFKLFRFLFEKWKEKRPLPNLSVNIELRNEDIYDALSRLPGSSFDLLLESNVLNENEGQSHIRNVKFAQGVGRCLRKDGLAFLIEPYSKGGVKNKDLWQLMQREQALNLFFASTNQAVNIAGLSLQQEAKNIGLRNNTMKMHRFEVGVYISVKS